VAQLAGGHRPQLAGDGDVALGRGLEAAALDHPHRRFDDRFGSQAVAGSGFKTENVAGEMEGADLAAAVAEEAIAADRAARDLVDVFGGFALAEDAFVAAVSEFGGDELG